MPTPSQNILLAVLLVITSTGTQTQEVNLVSVEQLQKAIIEDESKIQVINFWATWCAPCVKEMPLFEKLHLSDGRVHVRLVSMDMDLDPNPVKVMAFVRRKKLLSEVLILNEKNPPNGWIDRIEKTWSGALPATLIVNNRNGKRRFIERQLQEGELEKLIDEVNK